jgi:uncharacterized membrane protein SpoIIM required for sporulation
MKQQPFEARHEAEWQALEAWLASRARPRRATPPCAALDDTAFPAAYRRLCQHYALAERRGYSPRLLARLQDLVQRGHAVLYRPPPPRWMAALGFVVAGFPRLVRAQRGYLGAAATLFFLPLIGIGLLLQWRPELVHTLFSAELLAQFEAMYDPEASDRRLGRESGSDLQMFGHYVMNNISIGFRSFASGLVGALGPIFILLLNGVMIGGVAGHLTAIGYGDPFWRFVAGHSAPELLAIVIAGAAGLRIGMALLAPGQRTRGRALVEDGRIGAQLILGVFLMLLFAAFVEAFWSSIGWMPAAVKYSVGIGMWTLFLLWLGLAGRQRAAG